MIRIVIADDHTILREGLRQLLGSAPDIAVVAEAADGHEVMTVEGLAVAGALHPIQQAFWDKHALQCGFCTPGMMLASYVLLKQNPEPSEADIREGLAGNLCRCTGYQNIVKAVQQAADTLRQPAAAGQ